MPSRVQRRSIIALGFGCLTAFGTQAFQGEQNPLPPQPFQSTQSRAEIRAQARNPVQISNGGTGIQAQPNMADRATVRAGARAIAAEGAATYGEN
jgi:hypothetical protein